MKCYLEKFKNTITMFIFPLFIQFRVRGKKQNKKNKNKWKWVNNSIAFSSVLQNRLTPSQSKMSNKWVWVWKTKKITNQTRHNKKISEKKKLSPYTFAHTMQKPSIKNAGYICVWVRRVNVNACNVCVRVSGVNQAALGAASQLLNRQRQGRKELRSLKVQREKLKKIIKYLQQVNLSCLNKFATGNTCGTNFLLALAFAPGLCNSAQ